MEIRGTTNHSVALTMVHKIYENNW